MPRYLLLLSTPHICSAGLGASGSRCMLPTQAVSSLRRATRNPSRLVPIVYADVSMGRRALSTSAVSRSRSSFSQSSSGLSSPPPLSAWPAPSGMIRSHTSSYIRSGCIHERGRVQRRFGLSSAGGNAHGSPIWGSRAFGSSASTYYLLLKLSSLYFTPFTHSIVNGVILYTGDTHAYPIVFFIFSLRLINACSCIS